jgi:hypothetical protein
MSSSLIKWYFPNRFGVKKVIYLDYFFLVSYRYGVWLPLDMVHGNEEEGAWNMTSVAQIRVRGLTSTHCRLG